MQTAMLNENSLLASIGKFFQSMDKYNDTEVVLKF